MARNDLGGRVRRAATPARLVAQGAAAATLARARALRGDSAGDIVADPRLVAVAEDMARSLGEMKGAAMKIGQALSFVDVSVVPAEYRQALSILQSEAPPMPFADVVRVVTEELGAPPAEAFDWFSPEPIAAASIGQVHMARLGEREVVVKVQYPGVAKAVEADLRNAALLSAVARLGQKLLAGLVGDVDVRALVDEVRDRVGEELDYRIEARNQAEVAAQWADDPDVVIPAVVAERSTRRVLTTEYVDAMRWSGAVAAPQADRDRWGQVLARFIYTSGLHHGVVNVDTHPGNYLFLDDGRVAFLDFGCVSRIDEDQRARSRRMVAACIADDEEAMLDAFVDAGYLKARDGFRPDALLQPLRLAISSVQAPQPFRYSRDHMEELIAQGLRLRIGADELKLLRRVDMPREYVLMARAVVGLEAVLCHLEATIDYDAVFADLG